ncbi:glutathione S-transferase family protein [Roseibium sp. CAU 1637]|uniref:Glutathione S-transferase family protein n=1 Tax=Roseibium limicola TaxID=2816037 RepID=A0A939EL22_9HYPH|nr:glutathione S-transferase family protein [Roseibium limicola]MBO0344591.1 glutathione S-transferase family protein [Roseibium limicola]
MTDLLLYIGNKNYSSWSMRAWVALKAAGVPFREELIPFDFEAGNPNIKAVSNSGKVPCLKDGQLEVWESLAIIEYVAELFPDAEIWPRKVTERAYARAVSTEMATGFSALRSACPMNLRRAPETLSVGQEVLADIARIEAIWTMCLEASSGPYLFGDFSAADAMYAPVVFRISTYGLPVKGRSKAYMEAVMAHPAVKTWVEEGVQEPWSVAGAELP